MGAPRLEGGCEVIEKQEISELARELSLDLHVVEKDYVLGWLSSRDWNAFANALENADKPRPMLSAAMKHHREWQAKR